MGDILDDYSAALEQYMAEWRKLIQARTNQAFFTELKPVALGWKVTTSEAYRKTYEALHGQCDRIVETWMNGRWIAEMHLKDERLPYGIRLIKLMQTRPGSSDVAGLDHVDFYSPAVRGVEAILKNEPNLEWSWERNDVVDQYAWISVWFDGTEAKLKADTVIDIIQRELAELNDELKQA